MFQGKQFLLINYSRNYSAINCFCLLSIKGTPSRVGGITFKELAKETMDRHMLTFQPQCDTLVIREPGNYHWRQGGEKHLNDPVSIGVLQVYYSIHFYV
jgi:glutamate synthase domain-containing protein 2